MNAMKQATNPGDYERYQAVYLSLSGYFNQEIVKIIGRCGHPVCNYIRAYKEKGLLGLDRIKPPVNKSNLTDEQRLLLKETITYKRRDEVGFSARANCTLSPGAQFIEREFSVSYTLKGVTKLLHALGLSYTRPTYTLKKAVPEQQRQFKEETFPVLKKLMDGNIDHLLFENGSMIRDYQAIDRTWFLKGKQRVIPTYGQHRSVKMFGTINYGTGEVLCNKEETRDAEAFLRLLQTVPDHYSQGKIVMILDNARIHHAKRIQPFLQENHDWLELVFLPPYSSQLNLMEGVWKWMKENVIPNVFFGSVQKIALAVQSFLSYINERLP